jgi:hypothetical protein
VEIFSPNGLARGELRWDGVRFPTAFAYDPGQRRFLVANPEWGVVEIFNAEGHSLGVFGQRGEAVDQMERLDALHVDPQGLVYGRHLQRGLPVTSVGDGGSGSVEFGQLDSKWLVIGFCLVSEEAECNGLAQQQGRVAVAAPVDAGVDSVAEADIVAEFVQLSVDCKLPCI